jgi:tetratricopeptide (TPR) repeat protein
VAAGNGFPLGRAHHADLLALAQLRVGDHAGALAATAEGIALYLDSPAQDIAGYLYNVRGVVRLQLDDLAAAEEELVKAVTLAADYGVDRLEGTCATNLAWVLLRASRLDEAGQAAARGSARLASNGVAAESTGRALDELLSAPERGDASRVREALDRATAGSVGKRRRLHAARGRAGRPDLRPRRRLAPASPVRGPTGHRVG